VTLRWVLGWRDERILDIDRRGIHKKKSLSDLAIYARAIRRTSQTKKKREMKVAVN
jgi:hypothetical protein